MGEPGSVIVLGLERSVGSRTSVGLEAVHVRHDLVGGVVARWFVSRGGFILGSAGARFDDGLHGSLDVGGGADLMWGGRTVRLETRFHEGEYLFWSVGLVLGSLTGGKG